MKLQYGTTLGIPSKGISESLIRVIRAALASNVTEILIAINPPYGEMEFFENLSDSRVRVHLHDVDVGLYGNFRWLVKNAKFEFLKILCTDDSLSPDFDEAVTFFRDKSEPLCVLSWSYREYCPDRLDFFGVAAPGRLPILTDTLARTLFSPEPSWIFGIWKTAWLQENFPRRNFDWLDCILLARLVSTGLTVYTLPNPQVIGTWEWANKIPAPIHEWHKPGWAIWNYAILLPRFIKLDWRSLVYFLQHVRKLRRGTRSLNARLQKTRLDKKGR